MVITQFHAYTMDRNQSVQKFTNKLLKNPVDYCIIIIINLSKRKKRGEVVNFEANGMLPSGLHEYSFDQFMAQFVDGVPTSQTRKEIANALVNFSKEIYAIGIPYEFWVDGSYVTTKTNPNDADIVVFLQVPAASVIFPIWNSLRQKYSKWLDIYFAYATSPENQRVLSPNDYQQVVNKRNYWRGQFGFDRADNPKGIVKIDCQSLLDYIKGGDIDATN